MRILISGSSGLIGSAISVALTRDGHTVGRLARPTRGAFAQTGDVLWDPVAGAFDAASANRFIIGLAARVILNLKTVYSCNNKYHAITSKQRP